MTARVTLERDGRRHDLQLEQVTADNLRRLFQVNPTETWIRDDCDGTAFFPQQDGNFSLQSQGVSPYATLVVEGPPAFPQSSLPSITVPCTPTSSSTLPMFRSVIAPKKPSSFNLKVVKATVSRNTKRKPDFQPISQTYIDLVDSSANVEHIIGVIHQRWGQDYTLVTSDGIQLEESPATQGLTFWKCPRRKFYAVLHKDMKDCSPSSSLKRPIFIDSEEEDFQPRRKRERKDEKLEILIAEIGSIKETLADMFSLSENSRIPVALKRILRDTFKCTICHRVPINPPVIISKCCKTILGCESCVNSWYSGPDQLVKTCPSCRAERGCIETMLLRGLDDFLTQISKAIETEEDHDETCKET